MSKRFLPDEFERELRRRLEQITGEITGEISRIVESAMRSIKPVVRQVIEQEYLLPEYDVYLRGDEVVAVIQLPGASKGSIDLRVADKTLALEAPFSEELMSKAKESKLFRYKGFRCSIELPKEVEPTGGSATYKDGVLIVRLPVQKPKGVRVEIE
ncbi:MAG: hypothetical protein DRN61_04915 [Thaumarchaeota archaeon]|nr:MAG: hypothetical protein DRN54_04055 [Nitrososphaerota archaeon]RLG03376.1 MAG: hypothetical protein DRN61_04915 [Nitrososphaerota archaeon]